MTTTTESPTRKRNHRTFTVRALLAATAVVAVLVALGMAFQPKQRVAAFLHVKSAESLLVLTRPDPTEVSAFKAKQIELFHSDAVLGGALKQPGIARLSIVQGKSDPVGWLRENLETKYPNDSEILCVQLASRHPDEAAKLVNAVVQVYLEMCVYPDARKLKLQRDELQRIYDERMQDARQRRKELIAIATTAGAAKTSGQPADKPVTKPAEKDAELARREALANQAFVQLEQAKIEAGSPSRVVLIAEAEVPQH